MTQQREDTRSGETPGQHLKSFGWMLLLTAIAFAFVGVNYFSPGMTLTVILILALAQAILQLVTFMHLTRRNQLPILFVTAGILFSIIIAVSIRIWRA
ncbi:cytochrome C oxidase subunit IV family protein [Paludifilum halophilum]|uniref:Cytochrome C oxidase subunit IV n=1 Tax=Paludifilum halophilum TaxID=1642702 RepID=A0A235B660_9BACL|nr:cytochrome C oxidase subunit IV family protein [Paludifilum halophilum]OYD07387.1 hypothetical protein CHM34_10780 [Paludifilum halophilum]